MRKAAPLGLILAAMLVFAGTAGSMQAKKKKPAKFVGASFTHPEGESTSWVCAKVKKTTKAKAKLRVSGPGANVQDETYVVTLKGVGTKTASFEISAPGPYKFTLKIGTSVVKRSINVTNPPTPAQGTFACPQG